MNSYNLKNVRYDISIHPTNIIRMPNSKINETVANATTQLLQSCIKG